MVLISAMVDNIVTETMIENIFNDDFIIIVNNELSIMTTLSRVDTYKIILDMFNATNIKVKEL